MSNVRLARELVRMARMLVADGEEEVSMEESPRETRIRIMNELNGLCDEIGKFCDENRLFKPSSSGKLTTGYFDKLEKDARRNKKDQATMDTIDGFRERFLELSAKYEEAHSKWKEQTRLEKEQRSEQKELARKLEEARENGKKYILYKKEGGLWRIMSCVFMEYEKGDGSIKQVTKGSLGGLVESEGNLSQTKGCWVDDNAKVYGHAFVYGNAVVYDDAEVYGNAKVFEDAKVYDGAKVYGNAKVYVDAKVYDGAKVYGSAKVYGDSEVHGQGVEVEDDVLNEEVTE